MPRAAAAQGAAQKILPLDNIPDALSGKIGAPA
jgi:chemotaxis response regulator CheB